MVETPDDPSAWLDDPSDVPYPAPMNDSIDDSTDPSSDSSPPPPRPSEPADSVVCLAGVDWWYHNRGHSECQLMKHLARRAPILWINSIGMRMPTPGKTDIALRRYIRKLRSTLRSLRRDEGTGMWVYSPLFVPRYTEAWARRNGNLVAWQVRRLCRRLKFRRPALWVTLPTLARTVERLDCHPSVFNRCDEFSAFRDADQELFRGLESRLLAECDLTMYVSRELMEREAGQYREAEFLGHGVDFSLFADARPEEGPRSDGCPPELEGRPRPWVGFYGALDDFRMDVPLMESIADHLAPATLVLIGPEQMDLSAIKRHPNVVHIPQMPHDRLSGYAARFDVGIMPFLQNEFNRHCNPIKLKEYLALGYPIVAMRLPAFEPYAELIRVADDHPGFLRAIDEALEERDPDAVRRRRAAVAEDSWEKLADRVGDRLALPPATA